jgi:hypothetical protein
VRNRQDEPRPWRVYVGQPVPKDFTSKTSVRVYRWCVRKLGMRSTLYEAAPHGEWVKVPDDGEEQ